MLIPHRLIYPVYSPRAHRNPALAQVAKQQGEYLAQLFADGYISGDANTQKMTDSQKPFKYAHKGSLAYVGSDRAVMDVPSVSGRAAARRARACSNAWTWPPDAGGDG